MSNYKSKPKQRFSDQVKSVLIRKQIKNLSSPINSRIKKPTFDGEMRWLVHLLSDFDLCYKTVKTLSIQMGVKPRKVKTILDILLHNEIIKYSQHPDKEGVEVIHILFNKLSEFFEKDLPNLASQMPNLPGSLPNLANHSAILATPSANPAKTYKELTITLTNNRTITLNRRQQIYDFWKDQKLYDEWITKPISELTDDDNKLFDIILDISKNKTRCLDDFLP